MNTIYVRIRDDAHFQQLKEDYNYLNWDFVRDGDYAHAIPKRKKKVDDKKRDSDKGRGKTDRPGSDAKRPAPRRTGELANRNNRSTTRTS